MGPRHSYVLGRSKRESHRGILISCPCACLYLIFSNFELKDLVTVVESLFPPLAGTQLRIHDEQSLTASGKFYVIVSKLYR